MTESLENRTLMAADANPWHNEYFPADVDQDQVFTPLDALLIINDLNLAGSRSLLASSQASASAAVAGGESESMSYKVDVDNDAWVSPQDALRLVNLLNGEGEDAPLVALTLTAVNLDGTALPLVNNVPTVQVGTKFLIRTTAQDLRTATPATGVSGAYLDVIYNQSLVGVDMRETQMISVSQSQQSQGTFRLTVTNPATNVQETTGDITFAYGVIDPDSGTTGPLPATTRTNIRLALEALNMVDPGEVVVEAPPKFNPIPGSNESYDFVVRFGGKFANVNVPEMVATKVTLALNPTVTQVSGVDPQNGVDFYRSVSFASRFRDAISAFNGQASPAVPNMVDEVGGTDFATSSSTPRTVFDFEVRATTAGTALFEANPSDTPPAKVLLHGVNEGIPASQIRFTNVTVNIVQAVDARDDSASGSEGSSVSIDVLANDVLNQGGTKRILGTYPQTVANGTVALDTRGTTDLSDDRLTFTPTSDYFGTTTFTYTAGDGQGNSDTATVTVTINPVNDAPVNTVPGAQTINEDNPFTFTGATALSVNDIDAGAAVINVGLTATNGTLALGVANPSGVSVTGNNSSSLQLSGSQADLRAALAAGVTFTPTSNFPATGTTGSATVVMTTSDQGNTGLNNLPVLSDTDTVTITVRAVNDAPVNSVPESQSMVEGTTLTLSGATRIQTTDVDAGTSPIRMTLALAPANAGILTVTSAASGATVSGNGTTSVVINGTLTAINSTLTNGVVYTPRTDPNPLNNFLGTATITVTTDDLGATGFTTTPQSDVDTITIDVRPAVRPFAANDSFTVDEDSLDTAAANQFDVLDNDVPHSGATLVLKSFTQPANGSVTRSGDLLLFKPAADFNGSTTFTYVINDSIQGTPEGGADSTGTVTITVREANDAPSGTDDPKSTSEDVALNFAASDLTANDSKGPANESGQTLTVSLPSGSTALGGTVVLNGSLITYTPPTNRNDLNGGPDTFVYQLTDNGTTNGAADPKSATATVTVTLVPVNDAPIAAADSTSTAEDIALTVIGSFFTGNDKPAPDSATDESGQTVAVTAVASTSTRGGTVQLISGSVVYSPPDDFHGSDTFTYTIQDNGQSGNPLANDFRTATGTVTVTVTEVNDAPTAGADPVVAIKNGGAVTFAPSVFLGNDSPGPASESGQTLTITGVSGASHGQVVLQNGSVVYTPNADYEGPDAFTYTVQDNGTTNGQADPKSATGTVNVNVLNYIPVKVSGYVYADLDNDGVKDANETALSGVDITLTGRDDVMGQAITPRTVSTNRDGYYEFVNLAPGEYFLQQAQPANMMDGRETTTSPVTVSSNDRFRFAMTLQENINSPSHVFANNNFGERGTLSAFMQLNYLLASSITTTGGQAEYLQGILFSFGDTAGLDLDWYSFREGWAGYSLGSFTLAADKLSAVLRVSNAQGQTFQTTVTVDSARLRIRTDANGRSMAYVVGSYNDFTWQQVAQAQVPSGEGEAAESGEALDRAEMLAAVFGGAGGDYAAAVDAALEDGLA